MKNLLLAIVAFAVLSCEKDNTGPKNDTDVLSKVKSAELVAASNTMTFQFLRHIDSACVGHNAFFSSLSVQQALSMTLNGAKGQTYDGIAKTLGFDNATISEINNYNNSLIDALVEADPKVIMEVANSIWPKQGFDIEQSFVNTNQEFFNAEVKVCDFADPATVNLINNWCAQKTHDKIKNVLDQIPGEAILYLINAIYFKGSWKYEFDKNGTHELNFFKSDGSSVMHELMSLEANLDYYKGSDFSVLALPYGDGKFRMIVVLPEEGKSVSQIISSLDPKKWKDILAQLHETKVSVVLPRFKFEFSSELKKILSKMGMGIAFTPMADFTGITKGGGIDISRVIHKSFVEVNETGTEAAAVTVIEFETTSLPPQEEKTYFIANHPFLYFIEEKSTGAVIFTGIMADPKEDKFEIK